MALAKRKPRFYFDSCALISWSTDNAQLARLFDTLNARHGWHLVTSSFLRLEVEPDHAGRQSQRERERLAAFFGMSSREIKPSSALVDLARAERSRLPLSAMDALHLAAAFVAGCEVFITLERAAKPMHASQLVRVTWPGQLLRELG